MPCIGTHLVGRPCTAYGLCHSVAVPTYVNDANAAWYQVVRRVSVDFFVQQCENLTEEVTLLFPPHFISKSVFDIPVQPSRKPLAAETRFGSSASLCEMFGKHSVTGTSFSLTTYVFPVSIIPPVLHISLLGAFAKFRKATISFVVSVRPYGTTRLPLDGFWLNLIFEFF
jgi:hypothetical protein